MQQWVVEGPEKRLDVFLARMLEGEVNRTRVGEWVEQGLVRVNGHPARKKGLALRGGETISLERPAEEAPALIPDAEAFPLDVLYEDEWLLILNKPAGLTVHPGAGATGLTLTDLLLRDYPQLHDPAFDPQRPGIVHRLDRDTSGLMVVALDPEALAILQQSFQEREVHKTYAALVAQPPRLRVGTLSWPLGRHPRYPHLRAVVPEDAPDAREALTRYWLLCANPRAALLRVLLHTGRTHQIRVHLAHLGHPVLGDTPYGRKDPFPRLALHAWTLSFPHPMRDTLLKARAPLHLDLRTPFLRGEDAPVPDACS